MCQYRGDRTFSSLLRPSVCRPTLCQLEASARVSLLQASLPSAAIQRQLRKLLMDSNIKIGSTDKGGVGVRLNGGAGSNDGSESGSGGGCDCG